MTFLGDLQVSKEMGVVRRGKSPVDPYGRSKFLIECGCGKWGRDWLEELDEMFATINSSSSSGRGKFMVECGCGKCMVDPCSWW